jgi:hypothetical protein
MKHIVHDGMSEHYKQVRLWHSSYRTLNVLLKGFTRLSLQWSTVDMRVENFMCRIQFGLQSSRRVIGVNCACLDSCSVYQFRFEELALQNTWTPFWYRLFICNRSTLAGIVLSIHFLTVYNGVRKASKYLMY